MLVSPSALAFNPLRNSYELRLLLLTYMWRKDSSIAKQP
ncbi:hypothetical protein CWATWH0402_1069 [Crocosphaera watsonii WH 0402]|uniref:Uncharacterized protein n=1 Tax=Crocosphaera watsonii WH 0402 TaxID=1284629 RepID=T2JYR7_CROWT|nr:hypothetical protein CWATWH0402_1069 [Crocosphaera watsonii WH 0402]